MPFWGWIVIGVVLLGAELALIDAAFYLIFVGVSAIVVGLVGLAGVMLPIWGQWLLFAGLAIATMVLFRKQLYEKLRGGLPGFEDKSMGNSVFMESALEPGAKTRVKHRGSSWTAINVGTTTIAAGTEAPIQEVDGLTIKLSAPQI